MEVRLVIDKAHFLCNYFSMLKKQFRLKKDSAFNATYKVRHSYCIGGVVLWVGKKKSDFKVDLKHQSRVGLLSHRQETDNTLIAPYENPNIPTKVGFVVSKKTHKRAVKRNRLKRLMRESYRLLLKEGNLGNSQNYLSLIFVGFEKALDKDFQQMKSIIEGLLKKIRV